MASKSRIARLVVVGMLAVRATALSAGSASASTGPAGAVVAGSKLPSGEIVVIG